MCCFDLVRNMWGFFSTSHAPITDNENISNKLYFCLGSLSNIAYILRPVDATSAILGIFYHFYPSRDGIPMVTLDDFWEKQTFDKFDAFWTPSGTICLITSDTDDPSLTRIYGVNIGTCVGVLMGSSSRSGVNQVSLSSIFSCAQLCGMPCTRSVQFGGIVPSLMNVTVEIHHQTPHEIVVRHDQFPCW